MWRTDQGSKEAVLGMMLQTVGLDAWIQRKWASNDQHDSKCPPLPPGVIHAYNPQATCIHWFYVQDMGQVCIEQRMTNCKSEWEIMTVYCNGECVANHKWESHK